MTRRVRASLRLAALLLPLLAAAPALARPGGGHTFGGAPSSSHFGGSGHGYGGGGGGGSGVGDELVWLLVRVLFFRHPLVGLVCVVVGFVIWRSAQRRLASFESWESSAAPRALAPPARVDLAGLRALDPDFSRVVFEDFAYRLYASAHRARHDARALAALAPYLSDAVRAKLETEPPVGAPVTQVVVGALQLLELRPIESSSPDERPALALSCEYLANLTLGHVTLYQRERWVMRRDADARTKPPEEVERLGCPNCGAPFESADGRRCAYCGQVVGDGRFGWQVYKRTVLESEARPPTLTGDVAEQGTDSPSVIDRECEAQWRALRARDPALDERALNARCNMIYAALNEAWGALDLTSARGFVSDGMFDYLRYWTDAYRAQNLCNRLEQAAISRVERVKVVLDRHFDAITLRLWASGLDYTIDTRTGRVVGGSRTRPRAYSEYWTLIRSAAASGSARTDATCPSCGAPLHVTMAGNCEHCGSHLTRGEFDWVLSKIEQDDVYAG